MLNLILNYPWLAVVLALILYIALFSLKPLIMYLLANKEKSSGDETKGEAGAHNRE